MNLEEKQDTAYKTAILAYLNQRVKTDSCLLAACRKETKTLEGVVSYVKQEAKKQATNEVACIPDNEVFGWVVHYILEDSISCEHTANPVQKKEKQQPVSGKAPEKKSKPIYTQLSLF